ncbi:MAG: zinc ribbon domain-containing protein [Patescibacteria group bacterium]
MSESINLNCPFCNKEIRPTDIFCPTCGKKLPDKNLPFSAMQKIKIYLVSVVLAPLGLYWFVKYFRNENSDKRKTAFITLYLTLFTLTTLTIISYYYVKQLNTYMESYDFSGLGL